MSYFTHSSTTTYLLLEFQKAAGAALVIEKWWKFAHFPFCLVTKPPELKKFYYQMVEV
jgi:hypothetical protein